MLVFFYIISVRVNMCLWFYDSRNIKYILSLAEKQGKILCSIVYNGKAVTSVELNYILAHKLPPPKKILIRFGKGWGRNTVVSGNSFNINHVFGTQPEQQRQQ